MREVAFVLCLVACGAPTAPEDAGSDAGAPGDAAAPDAGASPCDAVRVPPRTVEADTSWPCGRWTLDGPVTVRAGATLTLEPGSTIEAGDEDARVVVERDGRLIAEGTPARPIVIRGADGWDGVHLRGAARINVGACFEDPRPDTPECELPGWRERQDPRGAYGGDDDTSDCGVLRYVRVIGAPLTFSGCGSDTLVSHVRVDDAPGDGVTVRGGVVPLGHLLVVRPEGRGLVVDEGYRGDVQLLVVDHAGDDALRIGSRADRPEAPPRTDARLWNVTLLGDEDGRPLWIGDGAFAAVRNLVAVDFGEGPRFEVEDEAWPGSVSLAHALLVRVAEPGSERDEERLDDPERAIHTEPDPELEGYAPGRSLPEGEEPSFGPFTPADFGNRRAVFLGAVPFAGDDWTRELGPP